MREFLVTRVVHEHKRIRANTEEKAKQEMNHYGPQEVDDTICTDITAEELTPEPPNTTTRAQEATLE